MLEIGLINTYVAKQFMMNFSLALASLVQAADAIDEAFRQSLVQKIAIRALSPFFSQNFS
jgi:outer membrane protease